MLKLMTLIVDLLQKAKELMYIYDIRGDRNKNNILKYSWNTYSVNGDDKLLELAFVLFDDGQSVANPKTIGQEEPTDYLEALENLFFDSIKISNKRRLKLTKKFFYWACEVIESSTSIRYFARFRALWMVYIITPALSPYNYVNLKNLSISLLRGYLFSAPNLNNIYKLIKIKKENKVIISDLASLILILWCYTLSFQYELIIPNKFNRTRDEDSVEYMGKITRQFDLYLEFLDFIGSELQSYYTNHLNRSNKEFIIDGLIKQIGIISLIGIIVAGKNISRVISNFLDSSSRIDMINKVIDHINIFEYQIPQIFSEKDLFAETLIKKSTKLIKAFELLWQRFSLDSLSTCSKLIRIQSVALYNSIDKETFYRFSHLIESLSVEIKKANYYGTLSNLTIANAFKHVEFIHDNYLVKGTKIILDDSFGYPLKNEFALVGVTDTHPNQVDEDYILYLKTLLKESRTVSSFLKRHLYQIKEPDHIELLINKMLYHSINTKYEPKILSVIEEFLPSISDKKCTISLKNRLLKHQVSKSLSSGKYIDIYNILNNKDLTSDTWNFPSILAELIRNGYDDSHLLSVALEFIKIQSTSIVGWDSTYYLAIELAYYYSKFDGENDIVEIPVSYLATAYNSFAHNLTPSTHIIVLEILIQYDDSTNEQYYLQQLNNVNYNFIYSKYNTTLPRLLDQGEYFIAFSETYSIMGDWGLQVDKPSTYVQKMLRTKNSEKEGEIMRWQKRGEDIPKPFIGSKLILNSEFIRLGHFLFSEPLITDIQYDSIRKNFNDAAKLAIQSLNKAVLELTNIPSAIKDILISYTQQFNERFELFSLSEYSDDIG